MGDRMSSSLIGRTTSEQALHGLLRFFISNPKQALSQAPWPPALGSALRVSRKQQSKQLLSADTGKAAELGRFLHPFALRHGLIKAPCR